MGLRSWRSEKFVTRSERKRLLNPGSDHRQACRGYNRALRRFRRAEAKDEAGRYHDDRCYDRAMGALDDHELSDNGEGLTAEREEARKLHYLELRAHLLDVLDPD